MPPVLRTILATNMTAPWPDPGSASPAPKDVITYVALPVVLVISLFSPPFPGRGLIFAALIAVTVWACTVSPWPPNLGLDRPLRYGLSSSWLLVLPVLEKMLLHVPERELWRVDDDKIPPDRRRPPEFTWRKLWWAAALVATPRAVGWNFGSRRLNAKREAMRQMAIPRAKFVALRVLRACLLYLAMDAVMLAARKAAFPQQRAWDATTFWTIVYDELLMGATVYITMSLQFEVIAAIGVGLCLSRPEGSPLFLTTTGHTNWSSGLAAPIRKHRRVLHHRQRVVEILAHFHSSGESLPRHFPSPESPPLIASSCQPVLGFSHYLVRITHIPRHSILAYLVHLITAFSISAFFHGLGLSVVCPGYLSIRELAVDMTLFFMPQCLAVVVETLVSGIFARFTKPRPLGDGEEAPRHDIRSSQAFKSVCTVMSRTVGYIWVSCWFVFIGWWFVKAYVAVGIMDWQLPFSIWEYLLVPET